MDTVEARHGQGQGSVRSRLQAVAVSAEHRPEEAGGACWSAHARTPRLQVHSDRGAGLVSVSLEVVLSRCH